MPHLCPAALGVDWTEPKTPAPAANRTPSAFDFSMPVVSSARPETQPEQVDFKPAPKSDPSLTHQLATLMQQLSGPPRATDHASEGVPEIWSNTPPWVKAVAVGGLAAVVVIAVLWWAV
jgi:hypothetical protein